MKGTPTGTALLAAVFLSLAACGGSTAKPAADVVPPAADPGASLAAPLEDPFDLVSVSLYLRVTMGRLKAHPNADAI